MVMVTDLEAALEAAEAAEAVGVQVEAAGVTTTARAVAQYCIPLASLEAA